MPFFQKLLDDWKAKRDLENDILTLRESSDRRVVESLVSRMQRERDPRVVEPVIACLDHIDPDVRMYAVQILSVFRESHIFDHLLGRLQDPAPEVRAAAALALGESGDPRAFDPLVEGLLSGALDHEAVSALGALQDSRAIEYLTPLIKNSNDNMRIQVVRVLNDLGWEPVGSNEPAGSDELAVTYWAMLGRYDRCVAAGPAAIPVLKAALHKNLHNAHERWKVIDALVQLGWQPDANSLLSVYFAIRQGDWDQVLESGRLAVEPLIEALHAGNTGALQALVQIGAPAVKPLAGEFRHASSPLRQAMIEALGQIGRPAVPALIEILRMSRQALAQTEQEYEQQRLSAMRALERTPDPLAAEPLVEILIDPNSQALHAPVISALQTIGVPAAQRLISLLDPGFILRNINPQAGEQLLDDIAQLSMRALVGVGSPVVPLLLAALPHRNAYASLDLIRTLEQIGDPSALEKLQSVAESYTHRDPVLAEQVKSAARRAITRLG